MSTVYIGIGSNIDAEKNLTECAHMLRADFPDATFSSVYKTAARDAEDQDDFLNTVAKVETDAAPSDIQAVLQRIEFDLEKNLPYEKGPRTIDLDLLLYGTEMLESDDLQVPHPRMHERRFVLEPLYELIDGDSMFPGSGTTWNALLSKTMDQECEKVEMVL